MKVYEDVGDTMSKYILNGKIPILEPNVFIWAEWFEKADRQVEYTEIGKYAISTVFIGLDHSFGVFDKPILFETMIFELTNNGRNTCDKWNKERYSTWEEAVLGHKKICKQVINSIS